MDDPGRSFSRFTPSSERGPPAHSSETLADRMLGRKGLKKWHSRLMLTRRPLSYAPRESWLVLSGSAKL